MKSSLDLPKRIIHTEDGDYEAYICSQIDPKLVQTALYWETLFQDKRGLRRYKVAVQFAVEDIYFIKDGEPDDMEEKFGVTEVYEYIFPKGSEVCKGVQKAVSNPIVHKVGGEYL